MAMRMGRGYVGTSYRTGWRTGSSVAQILQIVLPHPEMVAYLVQNRNPNLLDQLLLAVAGQLDDFLKYINTIREHAGELDASLGHGVADVEAQEQVILTQAAVFQLLCRRPVLDLDAHCLQVPRKGLGELAQGFLDQLCKTLFTQVIGQGTKLPVQVAQGGTGVSPVLNEG